MSVQKFRSIEDMNRAARPPGTANFDQFLRHCARYWTIAPREYPRGVFRFRSVAHMRHPDLSAAIAGRRVPTPDE